MADIDLLLECKKGLDIQSESTDFNSILNPKILIVKAFMLGAGVSEAKLNDDLAVGIIVMGVADIWNSKGGEIKFSPLFYTMLGQLTAGSSLLVMTSSPANGATGIAVNVQPVLTFDKRLSGYNVQLVEYDTQDAVTIDLDLDITRKIITITPRSTLAAGTKYGLVVDATAVSGPTLGRTVTNFTTV